MARPSTATKSKPANKQASNQSSSRSVSTQSQRSGIPANLAEQFKKDAGKGVSTAQEDNLIPLIYVLQSNSPQVDKRGPNYIEGAENGDIWLRNASNPIIKGDEGMIFQPVHFSKDWVEWVPRDDGGGFVGRHPTLPAEAKQTKDPQNPNKVVYKMKNGNELKETRYHIGIVHTEDGERLPYVIPLTSTGHTVSRDLMSRMRSKVIDGVRAPAWAFLYRFTTKSRTNKSGTWNQFQIEDIGWVDMKDYENGKALFESVDSGEKRAADVEHDTDEDDDAM